MRSQAVPLHGMAIADARPAVPIRPDETADVDRFHE